VIASLQIGSAVFALAVAGLWFWSGIGSAPPMTWDGIGHLTEWLNRAARRNRWAALAASAAAFLAGIASLITP
jgi:hypothetical protein